VTRRAPTAPHVIFAVTAGPRAGFGHLLRARSLARALGVEPNVVLHGTDATKHRAVSLGCRLVNRRSVPDVLVVDDPVRARVRAWVRHARPHGVRVVVVDDLGISAVSADLVVDGTVAPGTIRGRFDTLLGPDYMILDPDIAHLRQRKTRPQAQRVLVALGGGSSAARAQVLADAIAAAVPDANVRVAAGFARRRRGPDGLAGELATAAVAVLAGGVSLYEACALGVPAIALPLNSGQAVTVRGIVRAGAALQASNIPEQVAALLHNAAARRRLSSAGRRLVDGRGAFRVAAAVRRLARERQSHEA
jgi:spore coat polysaccharide biosynthesis predicted glycosyltransferase SpsG